jgi:polyphosphate kinase
MLPPKPAELFHNVVRGRTHFNNNRPLAARRNGGDDEVYLSSADLMSRNLDRRLEVMFPIDDPLVKERIVREAIERPFADNVKLRWLRSDGTYVRADGAGREAMDSQASLIQ